MKRPVYLPLEKSSEVHTRKEKSLLCVIIFLYICQVAL